MAMLLVTLQLLQERMLHPPLCRGATAGAGGGRMPSSAFLFYSGRGFVQGREEWVGTKAMRCVGKHPSKIEQFYFDHLSFGKI